MPFDLFRAPLDEARSVTDVACSLCHAPAPIAFELSIGADVIVGCPGCGAEVALDAANRAAAACPRCRAGVALPFEDDPLLACERCLAGGRAAITKDTELGMVRWADAQQGWTHGLPGSVPPGWETSPPDAEGWMRVRVARAHLLELVRTPSYPTWQGDVWLFCCGEPMVFVGAWSRDRFAREGGGDGRALFDAIVEQPAPGLWERAHHDDTGIYVFACRRCARRRAHWDCT